MKKNCLVLLLFLLFFSSIPVYSINVGIYPPVQKVRAAPKDKVIGNIWVYNPSDVPVEIDIQPEDWSAGRNPGVAWLKIKQSKIKIKPKKYKEVKYEAIVPDDATGDLMSQIFFSSASCEDETGGVSIGTRIAAALYITVKGTEIVDAELSKLEVVKNLNNYDFIVRFINKGNVHLTTKGKIVLTNLVTQELREIEINPWSFRAGSMFPLHCWLENTVLAEGNYSAEAELFYTDPLGREKKVVSKLDFSIDKEGNVIK